MSSLVFDTIKILLTALIIFAVAQLSQRDTLLAAILASIPLVSVLAMMWMNHEGANSDEIINFSKQLKKLVIVTRGEKGAIAIQGEEVIESGIQQNLKILDLTLGH